MSTELNVTLVETPTLPQTEDQPEKIQAADIRYEPKVVQSVSQMNEIAADPSNAGRTFQVSQEVFDHFFRQHRFLPRPADDFDRINRLLGTNFPADEPGGMTRVCICPYCGYEFSLADHVEAAIRMGIHTADQLKEILAGDKYYLTVDTDKKREVLCLNCGETSFFPHCCYGTRDYAYAEVQTESV